MAFDMRPTTEISRLAEIGKAAEDRYKAQKAVAMNAPHIEKEAIRKYAPVIQEQTAKGIFDQLGSGLASYASNDGITVAPGDNVTNEEMQRARGLYGYTPSMQDIVNMRKEQYKLDSLPAVNDGSIGAAPDGGLSTIKLHGAMLGARG